MAVSVIKVPKWEIADTYTIGDNNPMFKSGGQLVLYVNKFAKKCMLAGTLKTKSYSSSNNSSPIEYLLDIPTAYIPDNARYMLFVFKNSTHIKGLGLLGKNNVNGTIACVCTNSIDADLDAIVNVEWNY